MGLPVERDAGDAAGRNQGRAAFSPDAHAKEPMAMSWTKSTLKEVVKEKIGTHQFLVVSNREPYIHTYGDNGVMCMTPASGMTVALDPIMRACGGTWIAHGSGEADREMVDDRDRVQVPPDDPSYALRRVWLTKEEEERFYYGYSNEGLWPLCHIVHVRPKFRKADWETYKSVNEKFADAVIEEIGDDSGFVFIQDYHFSLLPKMIKDRRPDIVVAQFWHIPWPNPESFRVCPQADEILGGLLGNDILGFHIRYHGMNFLESVERFLEARVDRERLSVFKEGRETLVRAFPISIDFDRVEAKAADESVDRRISLLRSDFRLRDRFLGIGIDRMDYTKGIVERFNAIDRFLEKYPEYIGRLVFLQLGPLSRIRIPVYRAYNDEIYGRVLDINEKWTRKGWQPILLHKKHLGLDDLLLYYRAADFCIVSSIHDGMNLVAKEFVASRVDEKGALILSKFTGSARELEQALMINPIATDQFADAIKEAVEMPPEQQVERMRRMRDSVRENNVYRWAGRIVEEMKKLK
jgi:trehalose-6-phosphate synthase